MAHTVKAETLENNSFTVPQANNDKERKKKGISKKEASKKKMEDLKKELEMNEHFMNLDQLLEKLETNLQTGLTSNIAARNLQRDGPNSLATPKGTPEWIKFLKQMTNGFALLLWAGAILCIIVYIIRVTNETDPTQDELYLGIVLALVVIITGCFSYYQVLPIQRKSYF